MPQARTIPGRDAGRSRLTRARLALVVVLAAALTLALVAASLLGARDDGGGGGGGATGAAVFGATEVEQLLAGIPQEGGVLGDPQAPVTLVEYADLQCPFCADWAARTFPELVEDYVRAGTLRIELRGLAFIGPESERALRTALAAGEQGRFWHVVELLYMNQGAENGGWVDDELLAAIGRSVPGLDGEAMLSAADSERVGAAMAEAAAQAEAAGVRGTPSFELGPTGGDLRPLQVTLLAPGEFRAAVDALLGR
ncbi:MAG TPA: thioredoxin domain-containing protein [Gaiellaceae bacterium]|nr:thioredoxin domain-containing protein [Gaiellaceae bacterium]